MACVMGCLVHICDMPRLICVDNFWRLSYVCIVYTFIRLSGACHYDDLVAVVVLGARADVPAQHPSACIRNTHAMHTLRVNCASSEAEKAAREVARRHTHTQWGQLWRAFVLWARAHMPSAGRSIAVASGSGDAAISALSSSMRSRVSDISSSKFTPSLTYTHVVVRYDLGKERPAPCIKVLLTVDRVLSLTKVSSSSRVL